MELKKNNNLKVLTPSGYQYFSHIKKTLNKCIEIFTINHYIKVTNLHLFNINNKDILAKDLKIGDFLETSDGLEKIIDIVKSDKLEEVYDLLNVENGSLYYTNDIISHNCFLSSTFKKLISDDIIMNFRKKLSSYNNDGEDIIVNPDDNNCKFTYTQYHKFDPRKTYLAAGDSSEGTGGDDSVLYVFDITKFSDIKMCAKFSRNDISTTEFAYVIYNILRQYYNPYLAIERNTTGTAVLDALCSTVYNYENVIVLNKHGRPGIMSHMQIKQKACMWIRELLSIEDFNIEIYDKQLIDEMDTFIKKDTAQHVVYAAMLKKHDDHIMSLIWAMYILTNELLQKYYNILSWATTSIGKTIPENIAPLQPYDISDKLYNELIQNSKETINTTLLSHNIIRNNAKRKIDRFFGDEEDEEESFSNNAMSHFNEIKSIEQYDEYHQKSLEEEIENNMFYRNMIY